MAESVFGKPVDNAIEEINAKIGTVPSGQTVEGQIDALNSNLTQIVEVPLTAGSGLASGFAECKAYRCGKIIHIQGLGEATGHSMWTDYVLLTVPGTFAHSGWMQSTSNNGENCTIEYGGKTIKMRPLAAALTSNQFRFSFVAFYNP